MFELREALVRQILFAMENQNVRYVIDTEKGTLIREELIPPEERPEDEADPAARYQDLPRWKSADGFFLMEQFLTEIHEPVIRDQLQTILMSGSRVFRRFKDTIRESPEIQRRYYRFKYLAMRDVVIEWYNTLRELAGLDTIELGADEELEDLLMSDITIQYLTDVPGERIKELDQIAFYEMHQETPDAFRRHLYARRTQSLPDPSAAASCVFGAHNPDSDLVGFLWLVHKRIDTDVTLCTIHQVFVLPEYRGLGIATELVTAAQTYVSETENAILEWRAGPDSPALRALVKSNGFHSLDHVFYESTIG
jgi:GNAT superfamily N-acetyltransferase